MSGFRDRIQAFMDPYTSRQEAEQEIASLRARVRRMERQREAGKRPARGVIVTRLLGAAEILDEYPHGDSWRIDPHDDHGWLTVLNVSAEPIANYRPRGWERVENGRADEITEKREEAKAS